MNFTCTTDDGEILTITDAAITRVRDYLEVPDVCRYCQSEVRLVNNKQVYGRSYGDWPYVYKCSNCDAYVGVHNGTIIPLGTLADAATRDARKRAKNAFNPLWQNGMMRRTAAYDWLADTLRIPVPQCHIGWFDVDDCERTIAAVNKLMLT